ncbi:diguanylate cyclase domain-containing protein [Litchfieldia salsa]|uniref:PAS domain S-box-containing protein/diguanylate cyclase (GGDEF) domain-containing protein n=1 Tax=Litchfieldia salsa TaxID=930152 RepID=A0A1H0W4F8_9BACI|nr:diguanylate cyclase [Litchfieldia salsa]SDP85610.1 PAS domain S-box-containing protein/diguanylate cyclase (GGDEF) domain-containing protein [Litchfieldia salsa]
MNSINHYRVTSKQDFSATNEFELIWNNTNDAIFLIAPDGSILKANPAFERILGYSSEELKGHLQPPILPQHLIEDQQPFLKRMEKGERLDYYEVQRLTKSGELLEIFASYSPILNVDGELLYIVAMYKDVTEQVAAQKKIMESGEKYRFIAENTSDLIMILNDKQTITYVSPSVAALLKIPPDDCLNKSILDFIYRNDILLFMAKLEKIENTQTPLQIELRYKVGDEGFLWMDLKLQNVVDDNQTRTILVSRDISERKKHEEELRYLAFHDSLTSLPNRYYFNQLLSKEIARCSNESTGIMLMYLDIDHFKDVNDQYGHAGGDAVLIEFSKRIKRSIRTTDIVCRLSGDEFIVILTAPNDQAEVHEIVERIQREIVKPMMIEKHSITITASIGISAYNRDISPEQLVKRADQALYDVKEKGKNSACYWCE